MARTAVIFPLFFFALTASLNAGDRRAAPGDEGATPTPEAPAAPAVSTVRQEEMTLAEMEGFFGELKVGSPLRLNFTNGSEYAGNFEGKELEKPVIYCRQGLLNRDEVPLQKVSEAYVIVSSTRTVRIRRTDVRPAPSPSE